MTTLASITLLPALLGFARHRVEVTRWRGLVAVVLVALALLAFGLEIPPVGGVFLFLAVVTIGASFFVRKLREKCPAGLPSRCARRSGTAGAASSSTVRGRCSSPASASFSSWRCRC